MQYAYSLEYHIEPTDTYQQRYYMKGTTYNTECTNTRNTHICSSTFG